MDRRRVVAAIGSLFVAIVGIALGRAYVFDGDADGAPNDGTGAANGAAGPDPEPPFEVETIDATGSEAGTVTIPPAGVGLLNVARTRCLTTEGMLSSIAGARDALQADGPPAAESVSYLTVIPPERSPGEPPADFADWWADHDGDWTLGVDRESRLFDHYRVRGFPTTILFVDGTVHWRERGDVSAGTLRNAIEAAIEAAE